MIKVHHLENSRSQRVLWLLEELGLDYEIVAYKRDPTTNLAPADLKRVHPLGKSPVLEVDGRVLAESGAIIEHLCETEADGKLGVAPGAPARFAYLYWLHFAEGSAMLPLMLGLYTRRLGEAAAPLQPRIASETQSHLGYLNAAYQGCDFLVEDRLTGADIQTSFVLDIAARDKLLAQYPNLARVRVHFHARPAYLRALDSGGPYALGA